MVPTDEARSTVEYEDYFVIKPAFRYFDRRFSGDGCKPVPEDFEYSSGTNRQWLTIEQLQHMIENI
jgi:UDP-N-acetylglucosamine 4,6-dehydratase